VWACLCLAEIMRGGSYSVWDSFIGVNVMYACAFREMSINFIRLFNAFFARGSLVVKALSCKSEGHGFET
jgi:hypothetical protein